MQSRLSILTGTLKLLGMALLAAVIVGAAFMGGFGVAYLQGAGVQPEIAEAAPLPTSSEQPEAFKVFWEAWRILEREFYGETPSDAERTYGALRGLIQSFGDPHTVFQDPQQSELERTELRGEFEGIGAVVSMEDGSLTIVSPIRGSPAEAAGLKSGDIIIAVDGESIASLSLMDAVLLIRGPRGSTVSLEVKRPGEAGTFVVEVVRDRIQIATVTARMLEDGIGYVQLSLFSQDSVNELRRALEGVRRDGARGLILDLRNNPGGFLQTALDVADEFLQDTVIAYEVKGDGSEQTFRATKRGAAEDLPLVVLINQGSASASEIVAAAIKESGRGVLIGTETFGKGSVQLTFTLGDGSTLHVTIAQWLTPERVQLTDNPLQPDIQVLVPDGLPADQDPQLQRAVDYLQRGALLPAPAPHAPLQPDAPTLLLPQAARQDSPLAWAVELFLRLTTRLAA